MEDIAYRPSKIWAMKSKFFSYRVLSYFSFLLFPVWTQKALDLGLASQSAIMVIYLLFMVGQWFLR